MPVYDYIAVDEKQCCPHCKGGFETVQSINDPHLTVCPNCGSPIKRQICAPALGRSKTDLDYRAKRAGFTKLRRLGKGEYQKEY